MKYLQIVFLCLLCFVGKAQIDLSDTSKWVKLERISRDNINSRVFRQIYIYAYNDSVTVVDSPYLHGTLFDQHDDDTLRYVVSTWFFYEVNGKCVNSVGRGSSSNKYTDYDEYINKEMLWEIWMDRRKRDYWLYTYSGRKRISFKNTPIKRAFLTAAP